MVHVGWCEDAAEIDQLAAFFAKNVTQSYISHSELQFGRAIAPSKWFPDLQAILKAEIEERVPFTPGAPIRVAAARADGVLVGIAYVTFNLTVRIPFMIIEDIVIDELKRGSGLGQTVLDWIFAQGRKEGVSRAFLESGKDNHEAHHFFERNGFKQVSVVMMAELLK